MTRTPPKRPATRQDQEAALHRAGKAARDGDPLGMLAGLHEARVFDGLWDRLRFRWSGLGDAAIEESIATATDELFQAVQAGKQVGNLVGFLWKTSWRTAEKQHRDRHHVDTIDPAVIDQIPDRGTRSEDSDTTDSTWEQDGKAKAIERARALLPRLGAGNIQEVMAFILEAVASGRVEVTSREIGEALGLKPTTVRTLKMRGFGRMRRVAREAGMTGPNFALPDLADGDGEREEDGGEEEDAGS